MGRKHAKHSKDTADKHMAANEVVGQGRSAAYVGGVAVTNKLSGANLLYLKILLIAICAFVVNANTLANGFIFDDVSQVVNNKLITSINYIPEIFSSDATHAEKIGTSNYYRPIMNLIYLLNYYIFSGLKPFGFHLVNILFHVCDTVLVFLLADKLLRENKLNAMCSFISAPLIVALIFAVHPIHTEVVAWVACIPELSFTFFCLLSLLFNIKSTANFDKYHCLSIVFFGLALLCKETSVTLLPLLVLYDYMFRVDNKGLRWGAIRYLPYLLEVLLYGMVRYAVLSGVAPARYHGDLSALELVINIVVLFVQYLQKLVMPINLSFIHMFTPIKSLGDPQFLLSAVVIALLVISGYYVFKRQKTIFYAMTFIVVPIIPVLYILAFEESVFAERYLYFPSIGFALLLGTFINSNVYSKRPNVFLCSAGVILVVFSMLTVNRNKVWKDELSLWSDTVTHANDSYLVHAELGSALGESGDIYGAIKEYQEAIRIRPNNYLLHNTLGTAYGGLGDVSNALAQYKIALSLNSNSFEAHNNVGNIYFRKGDLDSAISEYKEALRINPNGWETHNNLGSALLNKGAVDLAAKEYMEALKINPNFSQARENLDAVLARRMRQNNPK